MARAVPWRAGSDRDVPKRFAGDRAAGHSLASAQVGFERSDGGGRQDALVACSTVGLQRVERAQLVTQFHQLEKRNAARHWRKHSSGEQRSKPSLTRTKEPPGSASERTWHEADRMVAAARLPGTSRCVGSDVKTIAPVRSSRTSRALGLHASASPSRTLPNASARGT